MKIVVSKLAIIGLFLSTGAYADEDSVETPPPAAENETQAVESLQAVVRESPAMDFLELETSSVIGNRELPKVLYIVPWKKADLGDLVGKPVNSLLDEVLEPVDRDEFQRHLDYYEQLYGVDAESK